MIAVTLLIALVDIVMPPEDPISTATAASSVPAAAAAGMGISIMDLDTSVTIVQGEETPVIELRDESTSMVVNVDIV